MAVNLDATDWAILAELQRDGRIPLAELGRRVSLSSSATTERVRRLEALGVVTGYHATVDLGLAGFPLLAVIRLRYPGSSHQPLRQLLAERPEILECLRTTGDDCYLLRVAAASMAHLEQVADALARFGGVTTNLVYSQPLPLRGPAGPAGPAAFAEGGGHDGSAAGAAFLP
ncbi:Lrp/AsnC family transcriptional regulator [Streptomyces hainanensis]|uniref:Lrp/AsnC family transcriptional regulator n=1 Tax=Streptomyces hainanensis TaxID=402648 RepID=A0A4R4TDS7_9ACTN|nr:Lrp/AsnC family transcriptional regulator [Streptomyces hainanensis]TDC73312.1 Lrp/AsnC family transcriptional regulator [Streptomyces hainanensis]